MRNDIILFSTPNKNIDYPGLSLPMLTSSLRDKGVTVEQFDLNILLKDKLLTGASLSRIVDDTIPTFAKILRDSYEDLNRLYKISYYLHFLSDNYGFTSLEEVKTKVQAREFNWVFEKEDRFKQFLSLFKINRALHYIIDVSLSLSLLKTDDFLSKEIEAFILHWVNEVELKNPLIVGFSILDIQRNFSFKMIEKIRETFKGKIIVGGADPTRFPQEYLKYFRNVDYVFYREAEESLALFINYISGTRVKLEDIPGIWYRAKDNTIKNNRHLPVDLSNIHCPDFRDLPLNLYLTPALPIQASRGCYYQKCKFCIHWDTYCDFRIRNADKVVEDMRLLVHRHNAKYFHFTDDCLLIPHAEEIVDNIKDKKLDVRWLSYFRIEESINYELLKKIWEAGGRVMEMGLESASERVLSLMQKNISLINAKRIAADASKLGILIKFFMFHGYPGEEQIDLEQTIDFTKDLILNKMIRPFLPLRNRFELLRGSEIYKNVELGIESNIDKYWRPSGAFGIRAEYILSVDESVTEEKIGAFVDTLHQYMKVNKIFNTDDDNVMLDLLVLDYSPIRAGWRCL